jgi:hypothetical protein
LLVYFQDQIATTLAAGYGTHTLELGLENEGRVYIGPNDYIGFRPKVYYTSTWAEGGNIAVVVKPELDIRTPGWDDSDLLKNNYTTTTKILNGLSFRFRYTTEFNLKPAYFKDTDPTQVGSSAGFLTSVRFTPKLDLALNILGFAGVKNMDFGIQMVQQVQVTRTISYSTEENCPIATTGRYGVYFSKTWENHVFEFAASATLTTLDYYNTQLGNNGSAANTTAWNVTTNSATSKPNGQGTAGFNVAFDFEAAKRTVRFHFEYSGAARIRDFDFNKDNFVSFGTYWPYSSNIMSYISCKW